MLAVVIQKRAENAINKVASYLASIQHPETGERFIEDFFAFCEKRTLLRIKYSLCNNKVLAKHGYSCLTFKGKWVIVFKVTNGQFRVYRFIYGAKLR